MPPTMTEPPLLGALAHEVGEVLADRYVIEAQLGSGAMGTVFRVHDRRTNARLAVKGLNNPAPDLLMYFKREFREFADIRHPNLVRLGELFEAGGRVYFTMELVEGVDFITWVRPDGKLDEVRLRAGLRELASGLATLHAANQLHRDLKPENVLVDRGGRVVILDFGLAARLEDGRQRDDVLAVGTVAYMAPEQAAGAALGPRADWYAVGVLLYEALTGELPFDGDLLAVVNGKLTEDAPDPATRAEVPADLAALCRGLLARVANARPAPADILRQLAAGETRPRVVAPVAFVGRRRELELLAKALSDAQRGPVLQLVLGESGLGKTSLVQAFLAPLRSDERMILTGRCHQRETLPFKAFDGIADVLARRLATWPDDELEAVLPPERDLLGALFPALDQVPAIADANRPAGPAGTELDPREARRRAFATFAELLRRIAARRRTILFIDDLHRADPDSLDLLAAIATGGGPAPLVVGTARASEVTDRLIAMGAAGEIVAPRVLKLEPLEDGPARELARLALSRAVGAVAASATAPVAAIVAESRRHPGFILELTRATIEAARHPGSLDAVIAARVARLPADQRAVLEVLAIAEAPLRLGVLAAARGLPPEGLVPAIDALGEADLIAVSGRRSDDWVETYHDRVADAVREGLDADAGAAAHLALAGALDRAGDADPERVLSHFLAAGEHGPVLRLAIEAAHKAAASLEHRRTVRLCRLALRHGPADDEAERLHLAAGGALAALGHGLDAAEHYLEAARLAEGRADRAAVLDARRQAADQLLLSGAVDRGVEVLGEVLRAAGLGVAGSRTAVVARLAWARLRLRLRGTRLAPPRPMTPKLRARLEACRSAALGLAMVDTLRGAEYQAHFVRLALSSGDPGLASRALGIEAAYVATAGPRHAARARALLAEAERLAVTDFDRGWCDLSTAVTSHVLFEFEAAVAAADRASAAFVGRAGAGAWEQRNARLYAVRARWWCGRLAELGPRVRAEVADARRHGDHFTLVQLLVGVGANVWLAADELDTHRAHVEEARALWAAPTFQLPDFYRLTSQITGHHYAGEGAAAWRQLEATWPEVAASTMMRLEFMAAQAWHLRGGAAAAAAAAEPAARAALHAEVERCAARLAAMSTSYALGCAAGLRAAVASQRGDRSAAAAGLRDAAQHLGHGALATHAAAARRWADALAGADATGDDALRAQGVVAPARFAATLVPGVVV